MACAQRTVESSSEVIIFENCSRTWGEGEKEGERVVEDEEEEEDEFEEEDEEEEDDEVEEERVGEGERKGEGEEDDDEEVEVNGFKEGDSWGGRIFGSWEGGLRVIRIGAEGVVERGVVEDEVVEGEGGAIEVGTVVDKGWGCLQKSINVSKNSTNFIT